MKTFAQLIPGEFIFWIMKDKSFVVQKDNYGNVFHDGINFFEMEIDNLSFNKDVLSLNRKYNEFYGKWSSNLDIPREAFHEKTFETNDRFYFTEKEQRDSVMKKMALQEIAKAEKKIEASKDTEMWRIAEIRKNYYSVLNRT